MNSKNNLPIVLYRYDQQASCDEFVSSFQDDFELLLCVTDAVAEAHLNKKGRNISAVVVDQGSAPSSLFELTKKLSPLSLRMFLHQDIGLDAVMLLLEQGAINKCFAIPYDSNVVRSEVYASHIGVSHKPQIVSPEEVEVRTYHALIVDDETSATKYLKKQLKDLNCTCEILVADNAVGALALAKQYQLSLALVLTDQRMPGMLGNQLLSQIRNHNPDVIRVLTSAYEEVDVALNAVNEGQIFRYIRKPWDAKEICACIDSALTAYRANVSQRYERYSRVSTRFQELISNRKTALEKILSTTVYAYSGQKTLDDFFNYLESIDTLSPTTATLRASEETNLESELVHEFSHTVLSRLSKIPGSSEFTVTSMQRFYEALPGYLSGESEVCFLEERLTGEQGIMPIVAMEIINLLKHILESSNQRANILTLEYLNGCVLIKTKVNHEIPIFKHILSAHTRVTQQLLDQQCSMLVLLLVCRRQGGDVVFKGGKQTFSMTLSLPDFQESKIVSVDN